MYYEWRKYLHPSIRLEPVELKGRGRRYNEDFYQNLDEAINDIFLLIQQKTIYDEYAVFGHSMGSLLAYELYYKISRENHKNPRHIFFSGQAAPGAKEREKKLHTLAADEFIKEVTALGGMPEELLDNQELLELVIPRLRNDFRITESYVYERKELKIECGMTVFNGKDDDITLEELLSWKDHGSNGVKIHRFSGGHFFINKNIENITNIINSELTLT